jgi:hypothetical protein
MPNYWYEEIMSLDLCSSSALARLIGHHHYLNGCDQGQFDEWVDHPQDTRQF